MKQYRYESPEVLLRRRDRYVRAALAFLYAAVGVMVGSLVAALWNWGKS
jgi:hypothetical protein